MAYTKGNADEWFDPNGDDPDVYPTQVCDGCDRDIFEGDENVFRDEIFCDECFEEYEAEVQI